MATPRKPAILLFQPYEDAAIVSGTRLINDASDSGPLTDAQIRIYDVLDGTLITDYTHGAGGTNISISGLTMVAGRRYRARLRYKQSGGWGGWSRNSISKVNGDLPYQPLNVPDEAEDGGNLPIDPDFPIALSYVRPLDDWTVETGEVVRRPRQMPQRIGTPLKWRNLTEAQRSTLETFLKARINASEGFTTTDPIIGKLTFVAIRGTLDVKAVNIETGSGGDQLWEITLEAVERIQDRVFTVDKSAVKASGTDRIRRGP